MSSSRSCAICRAPHLALAVVAGLVWALGAWATGDTACTLAALAVGQGASSAAELGSLGAGAAGGVGAAWALFAPLARANLARIDALEQPRLWESFRPRFLLGLVLFDGGTVLLQTFAVKDAVGRLTMAAVNMAVSVGLGLSLLVFLEQLCWTRAFGAERRKRAAAAAAGDALLLSEEGGSSPDQSAGPDGGEGLQ